MSPSPRSPKVRPHSLLDVGSLALWLWTNLSRSVALLWRQATGSLKQRAGGLIVRGEEVLLLSSRKKKGFWILPGGTIERGETPSVAALREVSEEAGVSCKLHDKVGTFSDDASHASTSIFLMTVETDSGEWENMDCGRQRKWWRIHEAESKLKPRDRPALREYILRQQQQRDAADAAAAAPTAACTAHN